MDLIYMPEVLTYGCLRRPIFRDYEQSWNEDYLDYGESKSNYHYRQQQERTSSKDTCHMCRENKKRSLSNYIKKRSRRDSCNDIHEEDEGNVEVEEKKIVETEKQETKSNEHERKQKKENTEKK